MSEIEKRIISRRGPSDPGGLAVALKQAFNPRDDDWFYMGGTGAADVYRTQEHKSEQVGNLGVDLVRLAYREANLAWPLLHEMGDRFRWSELLRHEETGKNQQLNERLARAVMVGPHTKIRRIDPSVWTLYEIHDYPLGPLPQIIRRNSQRSTRRNNVISYVCHTSWPRWESVSDTVSGLDPNQRRERVSKLKILDKLAQGMLGADLLFFHTKIWAHNFAEYVANRSSKGQYLYKVCANGSKIEVREGDTTSRTIDLVVHSIGVDVNFWNQAASGVLDDLYSHLGHNFDLPAGRKVLFSYGRLDYTKGVPNRWRAINPFLEANPDFPDVLFLEIGGATRGGLPGFAEEWDDCIGVKAEVDTQHPGSLLWIDKLVPQSIIAPFSRLSRVGLFSSIMDGCNLACKEWLMCQNDKDPGVLCLSRTAGAWEELGEVALELNPHDPEQMAHTFRTALTMPLEQRLRRAARGKAILTLSPVQAWAQHLRHAAEDKISRLQFAAAAA